MATRARHAERRRDRRVGRDEREAIAVLLEHGDDRLRVGRETTAASTEDEERGSHRVAVVSLPGCDACRIKSGMLSWIVTPTYGANTVCGCSSRSVLLRRSTNAPPNVNDVYGNTCTAAPTNSGGSEPGPP